MTVKDIPEDEVQDQDQGQVEDEGMFWLIFALLIICNLTIFLCAVFVWV